MVHLHQVHTEIPCPASQQYFLGCFPAYTDLLWSLHFLLVVGFMEWELNLEP